VKPARIAKLMAQLLAIIGCIAAAGTVSAARSEAQPVIGRLLATPVIKAQPGFNTKLLVPPGELYDPLFMVPRDDSVWMNDDGKVTDGHGSRILSLTLDGKISVLMGADKLLPVTGFDVVPDGFGKYTGQIFSLAQPTTGMKGALANHVIQRIDPGARDTSIFCTLPAAGRAGSRVAGYGVDARLGRPGALLPATSFRSRH
jgi:hypothetical protein